MSQVQNVKKATKASKAEKPAAPKTLKTAPPSTPGPVQITEELVAECRSKLLQAKANLLNQVKEVRNDLNSDDRGGDEADQTIRVLAEAEFLNRHERIRNQLLEIESALGRIENGSFGVCEETEEMIEPERLRAIPWTRLSIEGAEARESMNKRFKKSVSI